MVEISSYINLACYFALTLFLISVYFYRLKVIIKNFQDLAAAIDKEDVAGFTLVIKEFESVSPLVNMFSILSRDLSDPDPLHHAADSRTVRSLSLSLSNGSAEAAEDLRGSNFETYRYNLKYYQILHTFL